MYPANRQQQQQPIQSSQTQPLISHLSSVQHSSNDDMPPRKRTKKVRACDLCRRKKIRCDYDQANPQNPCSSCKSYSKACTFDEVAKKRGPPKGYVEGLESRLRRMEELLMNIAANGNLPAEAIKTIMENNSSPSEESDLESHHTHLTEDVEDKTRSYQRNSSCEERSNNEQNQIKSLDMTPDDNKERVNTPFSYMGSSSGIYILNRLFAKNASNLESKEKETLPRPLEGHEEDLMIVRYGCNVHNKLDFGRILNPDWKLPPKDLTDHLIRLYFIKMNPMLPILDEDKFYEEYQKANHAAIFIPIIMSVCRAACRLLKEDDLLLKKYNLERNTLFKDINKQLELYFDLDFLEPKIETIQVLLLNSANAVKWGIDSKDWIMTSIAVKMAQDLGLHRANTQQEDIPKKEMEAKKRLWWSAYVIDRWVCASLGRPLTISDADCDVEYPDPQNTQYILFIYLIKLAYILGDTLRKLCSPRARLMSEKGVNLENISRNLEQMLLEWKNSLPADLNLTAEELSQISRKDLDPGLERKLNNGAGKLYLAYCAVYLLSKRPYISMGLGNDSAVQMPSECIKCLKTSVDIFDVIDVTALLCGWSLSSYCISQTQMLLLLNYKNADANLIVESKNLAKRFRERHHELSLFITQPSIVPFMEALANVVGSDGNNKESEILHKQGHSSSIASTMAFQSADKKDETAIDQQSSLWDASNGIDWQEMIKLLAETGYQI